MKTLQDFKAFIYRKRKLNFRWYEGLCWSWSFGYSGYLFRITYKDWKISTTHMRYDGANCFWQFGPFILGRYGHGSCSKCYGEYE